MSEDQGSMSAQSGENQVQQCEATTVSPDEKHEATATVATSSSTQPSSVEGHELSNVALTTDSKQPNNDDASCSVGGSHGDNRTDHQKAKEKDRNNSSINRVKPEKDRKEMSKKEGKVERGSGAQFERESGKNSSSGARNDRRDRRMDSKADDSARFKDRGNYGNSNSKTASRSKSEDSKDERGDINRSTDMKGRGDEKSRKDTKSATSKRNPDDSYSKSHTKSQAEYHREDSYRRDRKDLDKQDKRGDKSKSRKETPKKDCEGEQSDNSGAALLNLLNKSSSKSNTPRGGRKREKEGDMKGKTAADLEAQWQKEEEERKKVEEEERRKEEERIRLEEERKRKLEEEKRIQEEELKSVEKYIEELTDIMNWKTDLRTRNISASDERPDERFYGKLDSNLKKNTAFVKKLKNLTENQKDSLIKDFQGLNLSKYIGEAAAAITEAKLKMSDINCALHICALFHQRYPEFSSLLLENWQKVLMSKKDDKINNPSKLRVDLRFFAELVAIGVFADKEGLQVLASQLMIIINNDKEEHNNLSIILSFCKHCGDDYAGLLPRRYRILAEKFEKRIPRSQFLPAERQRACRSLLKDYFASVCKHVVKDHKELKAMERQNRKILQTKGELSTERKEKFEATKQMYNKLFSNMQMFADVLDEDQPDLPEEEFKSDPEAAGLDMFNPLKDGEYQYEGDSSLFEDDETRMFYENLPDLKAFIPKILYKDSEEVTAGDPGTESALDEDMDSVNVEDIEKEMEAASKIERRDESSKDNREDELPPGELDVLHDNEDDDTDINATVRLILDAFIQQLPNCVNRELIDKAATDFCMNLNTKANRRKLVRALFTVHRTRYDLLPFYARLVAILHPCMPDVGNDLCTLLKGDFKWHVRKKDQINIESKLKTVRFIGELVKFKMFSKSEALHCIKMLMFDFSHHNIEMVCSLLETCGRFLYRSPDSHHRTKVYLDVMMRKKAALHLDGRYTTMIENAYYYCNPPEVKQETRKTRPPMHEYMRKLLYKDLSKVTTEKVLRQMRKLNWDDEESAAYASKCMIEIHNVRYNSIHCCANLLAGLAPYHEHIAIRVVDGLLEDIRLGMEINHPKYNQRRVSCVKYLGELYNYRMVESSVVFKILYSFILYGVSMEDDVISALDPPEHLFRLRLVCVLLDTCGQYFDRGSSKKKLDFFLVYFQKYVWFKKSNKIWNENRPFPVDVDYMVRDTVEALRPKLKLCESYEEACQAADQQDNELKAKIASVLTIQETTEEDDSAALTTIQETDESGPDDLSQQLSQFHLNDGDSTQESEVEGERRRTTSYSQGQSAEHVPHSLESDDNMMESAGEDEEEDQVTLLSGKPKLIKSVEDDDFMSAFDKMLSDNLQARNAESVKVPTLDIAVPMHLRGQKKEKMGVAPMIDDENNTVKFVLMTRKGNKQQYTNLNVPMSAEFATKFKEREEAELAEKERMKRVTLDIHERQEEEDFQEMLASFNRPSPANINRERRVRYQHPKGAPDADLIFGSK